MELTITGSTIRPIRRRPPTRTDRAAWWFNRMHQAVDQAITWNARPTTSR